MADNYTHFSLMIEAVSKPESDWLLAEFERLDTELDDIKKLTPKEQKPYGELDETYYNSMGHGFELDFEEDGAWLHDSGGYGDLEQLNEFLRRFLKKFRPKDSIAYSAAFTCSKPRVGEFGGGQFLITKSKIKSCGGECIFKKRTPAP